ncbi:NADH dehydrogenase subunit A [Ferroglobus placidus DSM 10642]|uniref:NADH dehydrogenase subunit A n=1 Tax=Ferroglobus placidus (strain DSM 10642 / AEDII12DO) TaxID=589924 RepID=D3RZD9_FERPA|nr:NADH-quinone oxidoreductase subunit A [Ferroglobus placidus]ADC65852.1 NADH dehydrogenase subunit A [Ferroglobus placidus DSM 10642]
MEGAIVVAFVIVLSLIVDVSIYLLSKILPKKKPTPLKYERWESGNISVGFPKYTLPMQYYGFLMLFMAFEPVVVLMLLFAMFPGVTYLEFLIFVLVVMLPAFYFAYKIADEVSHRRDVYG